MMKQNEAMQNANKNLTEMVFILDRSGSMHGLERDTVGGFNAMIEKQQQTEGEALVSTVLFNHESRVIHDRVPLDRVKPMTMRDYTVSGSTAMLDAIGDAIRHIRTVHKYARPEDVPAHTVVVITTDGMENASRRYDRAKIRQMIDEQQKKGWEFIFLGANIDAGAAAEEIGIRAECAADCCCDEQGIEVNFQAINEAVRCVRSAAPLTASWKKNVDADVKARRR
jgi:uncharacterized protein YegL